MLVEYIFDYSKKGLVYILSVIIVIITIVHMSVDKYLLTRAYLRFLLLLPCKLEPRAADAIERETRAYMCVCAGLERGVFGSCPPPRPQFIGSAMIELAAVHSEH
jgi:hypothetical protein